MFKTTDLQTAWEEWLQERKERKLKKFTDRGLKAAITHLLTISNNDEQIAVQIINQSIAQGWQGLFPLKNIPNGSNRTTDNTSNAGKPTRFSAYAEWINGNASGSD
jgi:hypothetical protein